MKNSILILTFLILTVAGCKNAPVSQYSYQPPVEINDGLEVGSLEEAGIDQDLMEKAVDKIRSGKFKEVHSMLIYKDAKLVLEEYFPGHEYQWDAPGHHAEWVTWDRSKQHVIQSVSKSITSACIGIAIDKGFIQGAGQSIFDYLPGHQHLKTGGREKITIEHLLTMTSGLEWDEWHSSLSSIENDQIAIWFSEKDPVEYTLSKPLVADPGTRFIYSGGNMEILSFILENASGMTIDEFSSRYLFEPLGISAFEWWLKFRTGESHAAGGLKLTPRGMVKIGATYLNNGMWNGNRVIAETWVEKSSTSYPANQGIKIPGEDLGRVGYAYTWWTKRVKSAGKTLDVYWGNGWGGQKIMVLPDLNTVIVFTGGTFNSKVRQFRIIDKYIIPAIT